MSSKRPSAETWTDIERLFAAALDLEPDERERWLETASDDPGVRAEVRRLLRSHETAGDFLARLDTRGAAELVRTAPPAPEDGELEAVGPYRVVRLLARGGMGVVYLARDERLGRHVALKCLPSRFETDPDARARFLAEARTASTIDHPNVATVHDVGETPDGGMFIAMSYYEGDTLAERIGGGPTTVDEALRLAGQIADGLAAAHERGIVHRDIKPANVLVTESGGVRVLDFGIARTGEAHLTREGVRLGTVAYMSPEQTRGEAVDARSDVWSLGTLLYEMLTGRRPFTGPNDAVVIHSIRHDAPPALETIRPDLPKPLVALVEQCLAKQRDDRPADGGAVAAELARIDGRASGVPALRGPVTRRWPALVSGLVVAVLVVAAGATWLAGIDDPVPEAQALDPDLMLVLPFAPTAEDSALARLGRDLGVTLSTSLDGLGELRTVDGTTVAARSSPADEGGLRAGFDLARELGAGRVLHGSLLWGDAPVGDGRRPVRADLTVYSTADGSAELRAPATAPGAEPGALTDSVAWAVVRGLWPSDRAPALEPHALSTASLPALRAFLEGELATAEGRWRDAPDAFERAFTIDSTFWLAYARYAGAMSYRSRPVPDEVRTIIDAHLADLPERERAIIEASRASGLSERLEKARALVERQPGSWRAWFALADQLIHNGMFLGATVEEARTAIERATSLHPNTATHWQHVFWMALAEGDTATTAVSLEELDRLGYDEATLQEVGLDELAFYRYVHGLAAGGDGDEPAMRAWRDSAANELARPLVRYSGPLDLESIAGSASIYGSHRGEIALNEAILRLPTGTAARTGAMYGIAQALAGRGAWDSALVVADRAVTTSEGGEPLLRALRLAVIGEWLGAVEPRRAAEWRSALERRLDGLDPGERTEIAWLDGLAAFARSDPAGVAGARARLAGVTTGSADATAGTAADDSLLVSTLDRSLAALALALDGRTEAAADSLLALERMRAERHLFRRYGNRHPYLTAVNRLTAAEWLTAAGRPDEAAWLLRWHQSIQFPADLAARADASLRGVIHFRRGGALAALGEPERARRHFLLAASELDRPVAGLRALADSAGAALER